jgi:protein TonB
MAATAGKAGGSAHAAATTATAMSASLRLASERGATSAFETALYDHIEQYETYPAAALAQHLQGVTLVVFAMDRDGLVLGVWIAKTSGAPILDRAAEDSIRRAQPLPPIPHQLPGRMTIELPIAFSVPD